MLPFPGDCKESIRKHGYVRISTESTEFSGCVHRSGMLAHLLVLFEKSSPKFPQWLHHLQSHQPSNIHRSYLPCSPVLFTIAVLDVSLLTGVRWSLRVVIVCICLMAKDIKHSSKHLLAIYTSFENYLFSSFAHLLKCMVLISLFGFWSTFKHSRYSPFTWSVDGRFFS